MRSPVCSSTVIGCTYDLPSGIYNMYVYDIEEEDTLSDDWVISSTNITITKSSTSCNSPLTSPELVTKGTTSAHDCLASE